MPDKKEHLFAEVLCDPEVMEQFANEESVHYQSKDDQLFKDLIKKYERKLHWHINNSLSGRQKEVVKLLIMGKTERDIGQILNITHQVVHIYKARAIKRLQDKIKL